jgi:hypothetical protein
MEKYVVRRDGDLDLEFEGERLAFVSSETGARGGLEVERAARWSELAVYRTRGGKYICEKIGRSAFEGEHDRFEAKVCEGAGCVFEFFGTGWLSKKLYEEARIRAAQRIE